MNVLRTIKMYRHEMEQRSYIDNVDCFLIFLVQCTKTRIIKTKKEKAKGIKSK